MSRKAAKQQVGVALFPFLAVLICTMGALIVLLVLLVQQARVDASTIAAQQFGGSASPESKELRERLEDAQWQRELLEKSRAEKVEELGQSRARLAHLEEHAQRLEARARELLAQAQSIDEGKKLRDEDLAQARAEVTRLKAEIDRKKKELDDSKKKTPDGKEWYALIPYDGPNGTRRRPIYIECTEFGVIIQPEGLILRADDFSGPLGPGNPLDMALRAIREHIERTAGDKAAQPYPLLVVRPGGIVAYGAARAAMKAWDDEFGYELISDEKQLDFGAADPALSARLSKTVADARQRQAALIAMMPRRYQGDEPLKSFAADPATMAPSQRSGGVGGLGSGTGSGNGVSSGSGNGTGLPGGSGPAGGGFAGGSAAGSGFGPGSSGGGGSLGPRGMPGGGPGGIGQTGFAGGPGGGGNGGSPWTGAGGGNSGGPFGSGGGAANSGGMPGSGTVGGSGLANGAGGAGGFPQSALNGGASGSTFGGGAGQGGSGQGGTGQGGGGQAGGGQAGGGQVAGGPSLGSAGSGLGGGNASSGGGNSGGGFAQGSAGSGNGSASSGSSGGGSGGSSSGSMAGGGGQAGGSAMGGGSSFSMGQSGPGMPNFNFGNNQKSPPSNSNSSSSGRSGSRSASNRGKNWALPDAKPHQIGVTRPIRVSVLADRIILVPEVGDDHGPQIVKVAPELGPDDVNHFVTAVQNEVKGWGLAVSDGYWKPVLQADVAPEAERHFLNLQTALSGSGIDIVRR